MLKKTDLSKQFELVVQQEIKNYNDSLNGVLESLREVKQEIKDVNQEYLANYAAIHSLQGSLTIEIENIKDFLKTLAERLDRTFNDQRVINERNALEMRDVTSAFHTKISADTDLFSKIEAVSNHIHKVECQSRNDQRVINDNLDDLLRRFRQELLKTKNEILDAPTEASLVKKELEEKLFSHTVDVDGIMRELRIYKHDNMVTEKKIENIYMLLERLKKSEG